MTPCVALWLRGGETRRSGTACGRPARWKVQFTTFVLPCCRYHLFRVGKELAERGAKFKFEKIKKRKGR